jgi:hypothetical protein
MSADPWVWSERSRTLAYCAIGLCWDGFGHGGNMARQDTAKVSQIFARSGEREQRKMEDLSLGGVMTVKKVRKLSSQLSAVTAGHPEFTLRAMNSIKWARACATSAHPPRMRVGDPPPIGLIRLCSWSNRARAAFRS